jgi:hypothetical protein
MTNRAIADVDRFAKLLRLAFATDKTHEAIAAIGAAKRLLDSSGLDAHWVADTFERGATLVAQMPDDESSERDDRSAAWFCFHRRRSLSPKERLFIENIVERAAPLTPRQAKWLHDIVDRLEAG